MKNNKNKAELIELVSEKVGFTKKDTELVINTFLDEMESTLKKHGNIKLTGFGVFSVKTQKERVGTHPKTHQRLVIPEAKVVKFKASTNLKNID